MMGLARAWLPALRSVDSHIGGLSIVFDGQVLSCKVREAKERNPADPTDHVCLVFATCYAVQGAENPERGVHRSELSILFGIRKLRTAPRNWFAVFFL